MDALTLAQDAAAWARSHPVVVALIAFTVAVGPVLLARGATLALAAWRHARLAAHAHQVLITPPPVVEAVGAGVF